MAWKSFWQIRRQREAERQRAAVSWYPTPPQFPWSVEAKSFVELACQVLPEMREHHVRNATAKIREGTSWRLEQNWRHTPLTMERLPRLMPVDLATLHRWRNRKLFYPHFGRHTEFTRETIYADLLRTCGTPADWSEDLPTRLRDRDKRKAQKTHGPIKPNEELSPEELLAVLPEVIRTLDGMNAQRVLITPLATGGWEFTVDQDKPLFYTLEQLSVRLGVSEREIRKWVRRRIITVYKPTTKMLFRLDEVLTDLTRFRLRSAHDPERNGRKLEFKVRL